MLLLQEGHRQRDTLREMRGEALRVMRALEELRPRLVGSTLTGHLQRGSEVQICVFAQSVAEARRLLDSARLPHHLEGVPAHREHPADLLGQLRISERLPVAVLVYPRCAADRPAPAQRAGGWERATIGELEGLLAQEYPEWDFSESVDETEDRGDRFQVYESLLLPLEHVQQSRATHPEGDALYHSLQVFELARERLPYDEEFLLAALLHDVGKAIDLQDTVGAALEALEGYITARTAWLIEHHHDAAALREGRLGARSRRRLTEAESYDELTLLAECDRLGRRCGVMVPEVDEALVYVRELSEACGE